MNDSEVKVIIENSEFSHNIGDCLWQTILTYLMKVIILTNIPTLLCEL